MIDSKNPAPAYPAAEADAQIDWLETQLEAIAQRRLEASLAEQIRHDR